MQPTSFPAVISIYLPSLVYLPVIPVTIRRDGSLQALRSRPRKRMRAGSSGGAAEDGGIARGAGMPEKGS